MIARRWFCSVVLVWLALLVGMGVAQETEDGLSLRLIRDNTLERIIVLARGPIVVGDADKFLRLFGEKASPPIIVVLASPGGDLVEGIRLGMAFRRLGVTTYIPSNGECFSACALAFFGGEFRGIDRGGALGVHRYWHTPGSLDGANPYQVEDATQEISGGVAEYLDEMNISQKVAIALLSTSSDDIHIFSDDEITDLRLENWLPPGVDTIRRRDGALVATDGWFRRMADCKARGLLLCPAPQGSTVDEAALPNARADWFEGLSQLFTAFVESPHP